MTTTDDRVRKMSLTPHNAPAVDYDQIPPGYRWPAIVQSFVFMRFRHSFVPHLRRKFGDPFTVRLLPKARPLTLFSSLQATKEIFAGDPATFHAGKGNAILGPIMGEHSLLLVDGAQHKRARKLLMPAFKPKALTEYEQVVTELARAECRRWATGEEFRSLERMNALTLEVILQVVFGVTDEDRLEKLRPLVLATVDIRPLVLLGWAYPGLQRFGPWKRVVDTQRALDDTAGEVPLTDAELRDQLVTLLLAGHETTASGLSWALYELGRHPDLMRRAQEAADSGDDDYLEAVMKESLRLHPVIPMVVRYLMEPATIAGWRLPAGVSIGPSIILAHRDQSNFPEPEAFRPDRFGKDAQAKVVPNTWIPFGGGVRRCIGAGFSLMEGVAVLREVLSTYDVAVREGHDDKPKVRNITSVPSRGARIMVQPRA